MSNDRSGTSTRMDFLVDDHPLQDEVVEGTIDTERRVGWLHTALHALNERELHIIRERRLDDDGVTLEALGEKLGISKSVSGRSKAGQWKSSRSHCWISTKWRLIRPDI